MTLNLDPKKSSAQDIAKEKLSNNIPIDWVGIKDFQIPVLLDGFHVPARFSIFVSLDDGRSRGIHMSRMSLLLHEHFKSEELHFSNLEKLLKACIESQKGISHSGKIKVSFLKPVKRKALKSDLEGWRMYPVFMEISQKNKEGFSYVLGAKVTYSSTCPCSASLSREIITEAFKKDFPEENLKSKKEVLDWLQAKASTATPHAQKSTAQFKLKLKPQGLQELCVLKYIDKVESLLGTAVQTLVKRADEAEFSHLNGSNLMFCEDAIRRLIPFFDKEASLLDYFIKVQHYESLHPFTVQSSASKGIAGGWKP